MLQSINIDGFVLELLLDFGLPTLRFDVFAPNFVTPSAFSHKGHSQLMACLCNLNLAIPEQSYHGASGRLNKPRWYSDSRVKQVVHNDEGNLTSDVT